MEVSRGEVWWVDLAEPVGSQPGFRRPCVIVQADALNQSRIRTVVVVPLISNLQWASAPGNLELSTEETGLPRDSVANVSQIVTVGKSQCVERVGRLPSAKIAAVLGGIDVILGR